MATPLVVSQRCFDWYCPGPEYLGMTEPLSEQEEIQAIQLRLCLLEKPCDMSSNSSVGNPSGEPWHPDNCWCHGTMKLPLLDPELVREKCLGIHNIFTTEGIEISGIRSASCEEVGCRGWVPTQSPWKWIEAVLKLGFNINFRLFSTDPTRFLCHLTPHGDGEANGISLAFFHALSTALGIKDA